MNDANLAQGPQPQTPRSAGPNPAPEVVPPVVRSTAPDEAPGTRPTASNRINSTLLHHHRASTLRDSFRYAFEGLAYCYRTQRNFRIHLAVGLTGTLMGLVLGLSTLEWAIFVLTVGLVLAAEMVNTMIESLVDLVTGEYHNLARIAKDVAAGIVLLTSIGSVLVGTLIFLPRLLAVLGL